MLKYLNIRRGFTIIEVTIALFLLSTGILAAFAVTQHIVIITETASSRLIAAYLAQEGVEIVRNIRDTNWLKRRDWKTGIIVGNREADFRDTALTPYAGRFLNIDAAGFYSYAPGTSTKFSRKIIITTSTVAGRLRIGVSVLVRWLERGQTHQLRAKGHLHNWRFK